jgi:hypothetical protein
MSKTKATTNLIILYDGLILAPKILYVQFTNNDPQNAFEATINEKFYSDTKGKLLILKKSYSEAVQLFENNDELKKYKRGQYYNCGITDFIKQLKDLYGKDSSAPKNLKCEQENIEDLKKEENSDSELSDEEKTKPKSKSKKNKKEEENLKDENLKDNTTDVKKKSKKNNTDEKDSKKNNTDEKDTKKKNKKNKDESDDNNDDDENEKEKDKKSKKNKDDDDKPKKESAKSKTKKTDDKSVKKNTINVKSSVKKVDDSSESDNDTIPLINTKPYESDDFDSDDMSD